MTIGTIPPPPGSVANFDNSPTLAPMITAVMVTLIVVTSIFIGLRIYTIFFILRKREAADLMLAVSWILATLCTILACIMTKFGLGRHLWDVPFSTFNLKFWKVGASMGVCYGMSIMLTKMSILQFYLKFLTTRPRLRMIIYVSMVIVVTYSFVTSFEWLYACQPLNKYFDLTIEGSCVNPTKFTVFNGVMNVVTDAMVLFFPLAILSDLHHLPIREKLAVTGIMMTGGLVVCISIVRAKMNIDALSMQDITWVSARLVLWWVVEMDMSIICACLVSLKPFLRKHFPRILGTPRQRPNLSFKLEVPRTPSHNEESPPSRDSDKTSTMAK